MDGIGLGASLVCFLHPGIYILQRLLVLDGIHEDDDITGLEVALREMAVLLLSGRVPETQLNVLVLLCPVVLF